MTKEGRLLPAGSTSTLLAVDADPLGMRTTSKPALLARDLAVDVHRDFTPVLTLLLPATQDPISRIQDG
jgi:hypothetical protein